MFQKYLQKLEDPNMPLLGPNYKVLTLFGLILPKNLIRRYIYMFFHAIIIFLLITQFADLWIIRDEFDLVLRNFKISLLSLTVAGKLISFMYYKNEWRLIIHYITKANIEQRKSVKIHNIQIIDRYTKYCRQLTYIYWAITSITGCNNAFLPAWKYMTSPTYRVNTRNGTEPYLEVVSCWVPWNKSSFEGYIAASIYEVFAVIWGVGLIISFDTTAMVIMVFFCGELELLKSDSSDIIGENEDFGDDTTFMERLKDCQRRHVELVKHAKLFDACLSPIMFLYMLVCSLVLCVSAYQMTIVTNIMEKFLTAEYLIYCIAQLFYFYWHSNDVLHTSKQLTKGPYESAWWKTNTKMRKNIYILTEQFNTSIVLSAGPFSRLTIGSFINILKGAYSYFTLLNKTQGNN